MTATAATDRKVRPQRPRWWAQVLAAVAFYAVYAEIRDIHGRLAVRDQTALARRHGLSVLHAERWLHIDVELGLQRAALHVRPLVVAMNVCDGTFRFLFTCGIFVGLLLFAAPETFRRPRNVLAITTGLVLVGLALFPTMPPRLLPASYGYVDTLATVGGLWSYNGGVIEHIADPYAAMPSLHIAWATRCAVALALTVHRTCLRCLLAAYPLIAAATVLATGAHWLLDLVAAEAMFWIAWSIAGRISQRRASGTPAPGHGGMLAVMELVSQR